MSEFVISRITAAAQRLKLPHMAASAADAATRAEQSQLGYLDFLDQLLEEEVTHRESGRFRRRARGSPGCRTTRPWKTSTSRSNLASMPGA